MIWDTPRFGATKSPTPTWCVLSDFEVDASMTHCFFVTVYSRKLTSKCALLYFRIGFFKYGRSSCSSLMLWSQESLQSCENMMPGHHGFPLEHLDLGKFRDPVNRKISKIIFKPQFSIQYLFTDGSLAAIRFAPKKTRGTAFTESIQEVECTPKSIGSVKIAGGVHHFQHTPIYVCIYIYM